METTTTEQELFIKMVMTEWDKQNNNFNRLLSSLTDAQLSKEIAPGKNTGVYLVGHLVAVSDGMLPLLDFGERLFPQLENIFIKNPDKAGLQKPSVAKLKENLEAVNTNSLNIFKRPNLWNGSKDIRPYQKKILQKNRIETS